MGCLNIEARYHRNVRLEETSRGHLVHSSDTESGPGITRGVALSLLSYSKTVKDTAFISGDLDNTKLQTNWIRTPAKIKELNWKRGDWKN